MSPIKNHFTNFFRKLKSGRLAIDELSFFLITIAFIAAVLMFFLNYHRFIFITWLLILIAYLRSFFKNRAKRTGESQTFNKVNPSIESTPQDDKHYYLNCKKCDQLLRIPKKTGHIKVTCPKCNSSFVKKTIRGRVNQLKQKSSN